MGAAVLGGVLLTAGPAHRAAPIDEPVLVEASDSNPLPPTGVVITPGNGQFTSVRWTASTEPNTSGYVVKVGTYQTTVTGTSTLMPITGLVNGTDYTVQVFTRTSYNLLGLQTGTGTVPATATSYPRDGVAPAAPTGVTTARGDQQVTVSWAANTESDLAGYRVLRDGTPVSGTLTARTFTDTGLTNDTAYRYTVQAVDVSRQWSASSTPAVSATPTDLTPPGTPTMLLAERGDRQVTLSWATNPEPDVASYRVLRDGVEIATVPAGSRGYTDTGLTNDRAYRYALVAVDTHANRSGPTATINATPTDLTPPAPPTGLAAARGENRVTLSWAANTEPDLASYRVLRDGVEVATVTGATSYVDTGLVNDRAYAYRLVAVDTHVNRSAVSDPAVSATPTDLTPPAPPTGLVATRGDKQVALTWTANTEPDLASYRVLRDGIEVATVSSGTTSYLDSGLTNDTGYAYRLVAVDTHGNRSTASDPAVPATPTDLTPPSAPSGLVAVRGDGQVGLSWTANTEPDLASYRVLRDGVEVATATGTSYTDTGLVNDRAYAYRLVAVDTHGNRSAASDPAVSATPTDLTPPAVPTGLAAARGENRVTLSWAANTEPDLASYRVLRDGVEVATVTGATSYVDTGLTNDTGYAYRLVAVDTTGNRSAPSGAVSATPTDLTAPGTPTGFVAVRGDGRVDLSWAANPETDVVGYRLLRDGVLLATVTGTSWADTAVTDDVTYAYRLAAVDGHGNVSVATAVVTATPTDLTPPAVPTGLTATRGDGQVVLTWTASSEPDLASYRVLRDGVEVATVTGTAYTATGLANDQAASFSLVAVDTHGNRSAASAPVGATPTDLTAPAPPTGVGTAPGDGQVTISWAPSPEPDVAGYRVLRDGVQVATVTGTSYTDTGLTNDTRHRYTVVAVDGHGNVSGPSATVDGTPTDLSAPAPPAGLSAVRGDGQVTLTWTANGEPDLASYAVLRDGVQVGTVTGTSFTDTGLVNDRSYAYAVVAVDGHGNRSVASTATAVPTDLTPPGAPVSPAATAGERAVTVTWSAPADLDVVGYQVLRGGVVVATTGGTSATVSGLAPGTAVDLVVVAVDGHGNVSVVSTTVSATPYDRTAPAAPTGLAGRAGSTVATLTWTAPVDVDPLTYRVLRDGVVVATTTATTTTVTGLVNGTSYAFAVQAVDPAGNVSPVSATVVVVPVGGTVPVQGSGQTGGLAVSGDGRFVVVGTRAKLDPADTNTAYELYRLDRTGGPATRIAPLPASATGATDPTNTAAPAISDDGRYLALATSAALVPSDTNGLPDVYRRDLVTGTWALVSVPVTGRVNPSVAGTELQPGSSVDATSPAVVISGDGDLVLFYSARADLGPADANGAVDVYAKRMSTGAVTRVSTSTTGGELPRTAMGPALALTPDGRFALFPAVGSSGPTVLYRKTLSGAGAGEARVVSTIGSTEVGVFRDTGDVDLSDDGRYVAFVTAAKPTAPTSSWSTGLAYRKDTTTGALAALGTGQTSAWEHQVALDPTGRYGFLSTAAPLIAGDTDGHTDVFRRDLDSGVLVLVTADEAGRQTAGPGGPVTTAEYGRVVAVSGDLVVLATSEALLPTDTNRLRDLYAKDLVTGAVVSPVA